MFHLLIFFFWLVGLIILNNFSLGGLSFFFSYNFKIETPKHLLQKERKANISVEETKSSFGNMNPSVQGMCMYFDWCHFLQAEVFKHVGLCFFHKFLPRTYLIEMIILKLLMFYPLVFWLKNMCMLNHCCLV